MSMQLLAAERSDSTLFGIRVLQSGYALLMLLIWTAMLPTDMPGASDELKCIKELAVPTFTFLARRSPSGGTVRALVTVGKLGKAKDIATTNSDKDLAEEVLVFLREATTYKESCEGQQFEILFTFRLEGQAEYDPQSVVRFSPPNHFLIITRPRKPSVN